ncbi:pyrroline-5-carboxylate reductase [Evansella vedderi]|uniref:Pyrroline-5-carboxylate reductase n=1 Tax=Evansella vedderi TaxID=38282 RepID=A0ABT9ZUQ5_9BACI|nr:hypothetical protein [Evansella vedderi]MDQ0254969.1 pyrroline-5-carboxylate reductase [Evansella vedderi]
MIVGFGKLAKAIIHVLPTDEKIYVFSRKKTKVEAYREVDSRVQWLDPNHFTKEKEVWLLLPPDEIPKFMEKYIHAFHRSATFYYCATKGSSSDIKHIVTPTQHVVPVKFITQGDQLMKDNRGMAAIPNANKAYIKRLDEWFGDSMEIVIGEEKDVLHLNKTATAKAIQLIMDFQEEMKRVGIPSKMVDHAVKQIVPGVIESYLNNSLGGFAKQVVAERRNKNSESR